MFSSLWGNANDQVDRMCQQLAALPQLARGFTAVGFSQGSQLLRAVVQRCQHLLPGGGVRVLVSMGGQHQGVMELPGCVAPGALNGSAGPSLYCRAMEALLSWGAYAPIVQRHVIQAQYFKVQILINMCCGGRPRSLEGIQPMSSSPPPPLPLPPNTHTHTTTTTHTPQTTPDCRTLST